MYIDHFEFISFHIYKKIIKTHIKIILLQFHLLFEYKELRDKYINIAFCERWQKSPHFRLD